MNIKYRAFSIVISIFLFALPILGQDDPAAPIITDGEHNGFLFANQTTSFLFSGTTGDIVTIEVKTTSGTADMLLELYGPDGNLLFSDDDSGDFLDPMISALPLPATGEYRIVVTRCDFCDESTSAGFILTLSGVGSGEALGQEELPEEAAVSKACDLVNYSEALNAAREILESGTLQDNFLAMEDLERNIRRTRIACVGLSFSSETEGMRPSIGPVEFENGLYRATWTTEGFGNINFVTVSGECDLGFSTQRLFSILSSEEGVASTGASVTFTSNNCVAVIEFERITEDWTLEFEPISG